MPAAYRKFDTRPVHHRDARDNLYTPYSNNTIVRFTPSGAMQELAGNHLNGFSGDGGPASAATLGAWGGGGGDEGNLYFVDAQNRRIRAVRYGAVLAPPNATVQAAANGSTIRPTVFDSAGHLAPNVRVDFASPASGASCTLSSPFAITDANGVATVTCTSNCVEGSYPVSARPVASSAIATAALTNEKCPNRRRSVRH